VAKENAGHGLDAESGSRVPYLHARLKEQPPRRVVTPVVVTPPRSASEAADAISLIAAKAASGGMDLNDAADLTKLLESYARVYAAADLEAIVARVRDEVRSELLNAGLNHGSYSVVETPIAQ
jgi:hypothetical protein